MSFFRQFLHAKSSISDKKYVSMSPKIACKNCSKLADCSFKYFRLSELFAILYITESASLSGKTIRSQKLEHTEKNKLQFATFKQFLHANLSFSVTLSHIFCLK